MSDIQKILSRRFKIAEEFIFGVEKYLNLISTIVQSLNPEEYKSTIADIALVKNFLQRDFTSKLTLNDVKILDEISAIYDELLKLEKIFVTLVSLLENPNYIKYALYEMSATYTMNIHHNRNHTIGLYDDYISETVNSDVEIFNIVFSKLVENNIDIIAWIMKNDNVVNKFTIKLIGFVIKSSTGSTQRNLILLIEKQKNMILDSKRLIMNEFKGVQALLVKYGLCPLTKSISAQKLFEYMKCKYNDKKPLDKNLQYLADTLLNGVIFINTASKSPVEFNIRGLIDIKHVEKYDLRTNQWNGLNKKIVDRFATAKLLQRGTDPEPIVKYLPSSKPHIDKWYVIETINGIELRLLGKYDIAPISTDLIQGLVHGISTRAHQYNSIQSESILNKCFDPHAQMFLQAYEVEKHSLPSAEPIKNAIIRELTEWVDTSLKKHKVKNIAEFKSLIINQQIITETLLDILTHNIGIHGKGSAEYMITYISKFDSIIRGFIRELETKIMGEQMFDRIFKELKEDDIHRYLVSRATDIISAAVNELDRNNSWTEYDVSLKEYFLEKKQAIV